MRSCSLFGQCAIIAALLVPARMVAAAEGPEIVGAYKCLGDAGGGKQYQGKVSIGKEGDCYLLKWEFANQRYTGLGIREENTLSVAIRDDANDKYTGIIVYRIEKGGKLVGRWSAFGSKGVTAAETLTPEKGVSTSGKDDASALEKLSGTWTLESRVSNGSELKGVNELQYQIKIDGNMWTTLIKERASDTDTIVVDPTTNHRSIDRTSTEDKTTQHGIYNLEGDTLTVAFGAPGAKRPDKFESAEGSGVSLSVYKRKK